MSRREEHRIDVLRHSGFTYHEARALKSKNLTSPAVRELIKERKDIVRSYRAEGYTKAEINTRIHAEHRAGGAQTIGRAIVFQLESIASRPDIVKQTKREETIRTGYRERYNYLTREKGYDAKEARTIARMGHIEPENRGKEFNTFVSQYESLKGSGFTREQCIRLAQFDARSQAQKDGFQQILDNQREEVDRRIREIMRLEGKDYDQAKTQYQQQVDKATAEGEDDPWDILRDILSPGKSGGSHKAKMKYNPNAMSDRRMRVYGRKRR